MDFEKRAINKYTSNQQAKVEHMKTEAAKKRSARVKAQEAAELLEAKRGYLPIIAAKMRADAKKVAPYLDIAKSDGLYNVLSPSKDNPRSSIGRLILSGTNRRNSSRKRVWVLTLDSSESEISHSRVYDSDNGSHQKGADIGIGIDQDGEYVKYSYRWSRERNAHSSVWSEKYKFLHKAIPVTDDELVPLDKITLEGVITIDDMDLIKNWETLLLSKV